MRYWKLKNTEDTSLIIAVINELDINYYILRYEYKAGMRGSYVAKSLRGAKMIASREFKREHKLIWECFR